VVEPFGAHPSYVQGSYDRDNHFYRDWDAIARDAATLAAWLDEWVYGVASRAEYVQKLGVERVASLKPSGQAPSGSVDYGSTDERAARDRELHRRRHRRPGPATAAFSKSEMMIVAAARELAGQRVCFVGSDCRTLPSTWPA